jgi:hypothetical protein
MPEKNSLSDSENLYFRSKTANFGRNHFLFDFLVCDLLLVFVIFYSTDWLQGITLTKVFIRRFVSNIAQSANKLIPLSV